MQPIISGAILVNKMADATGPDLVSTK